MVLKAQAPRSQAQRRKAQAAQQPCTGSGALPQGTGAVRCTAGDRRPGPKTEAQGTGAQLLGGTARGSRHRRPALRDSRHRRSGLKLFVRIYAYHFISYHIIFICSICRSSLCNLEASGDALLLIGTTTMPWTTYDESCKLQDVWDVSVSDVSQLLVQGLKARKWKRFQFMSVLKLRQFPQDPAGFTCQW